MKRVPRLLLVLPLVFLSWSCQDADPIGVPVQVPLTSAGVIFEVPGYMFLAPIGQATVSDQFLGGLSPTVTVCKWDSVLESCTSGTTVAELAGSSISLSTDNVYHVNWDTSDSPDIVNGDTYQIVVRLDGHALGTADIVVYTSMGQAKNAAGDAIALQDGRTLPIKFGVEPQALLEILDVPESQDYVIETFTTGGGVQLATVPSGDAAFQVDGGNIIIPGGGTEFTLLIAEKAIDPATGKCELSYGGPNTGGCYLYETFPGDVRFEFADASPAGIAGVCPDAAATGAYDLAKSDDGVTTFPPPPPSTTPSIINCGTDIIGQLPWGLRHFARLVLPSPLHAKDEGEMGMVGSFSTIFWAMPVVLESAGTLPTGPVAPGQTLQLPFKAEQTHDGNVSSVPGVQVDFSLPSGAGTLSAASGVTDANGIVTVGWTLPSAAGTYSLTAGVGGVAANVNAGTATNVDVTVQTGLAVAGTVFYSITPQANVLVQLIQGSATNQPLRADTTDAFGNYSFTNVPDGTYYVKAYGPTTEFIGWKASQVTVAGANVTRNIDLPKNIVLLSPTSGATVSTSQPTLTWTENLQAVRYTMQINVTNGWQLVDQQTNITTESYTVIPQLGLGVTYTWQVDAYDQAGHHVGTTNTAFTFTTSVPPS